MCVAETFLQDMRTTTKPRAATLPIQQIEYLKRFCFNQQNFTQSIGLPTAWKKSLAKYGLVFLAQKKQRSFALNVQCTNRKGGGKKNVASR